MKQQPKNMSRSVSSDIAAIVVLVKAAGGRKVRAHREQHPAEGGFLEITFELDSPKAFEEWVKKQKVTDLFHREDDDPEERIRLRTPTYKGTPDERYIKFLDSIKEVEARLGEK